MLSLRRLLGYRAEAVARHLRFLVSQALQRGVDSVVGDLASVWPDAWKQKFRLTAHLSLHKEHEDLL
ncbi:hypothetical protein A7X12_06675 [Sphingomonas sp. TDK1]|nr:hypothetical protein A7X12_06675 [Sphingomonas sp. TDK1]